MNLYLSLLNQRLMTTNKFEGRLLEQKEMVVRYHKVENSQELAEYNSLDKVVNTPAFQDNKQKLLKTKYHDTHEGKTAIRFKRLSMHPSVRLYLANKDDAKKAARYLKKQVIQRYIALLSETQKDEFQKENAFWKNAKRWYTTEESKQDARYNELKNNPDIRFYLSVDPKQIKELETFTETLHDDFDWSVLSDSQWKAGFAYPSKEFRAHHSYTNDRLAYNQGQNVKVNDSILHIYTKKHATVAPAWDTNKGLLMHQFQYTSDVLQNADATGITGGVIQVKAQGIGNLIHGVYLCGKKAQPIVSVFESHNNILYASAVSEKSTYHHKIGKKPFGFFIYTLVWNKEELIWYVNNIEVGRTRNTLPAEPLYIQLRTSAPTSKKASEGQLEVDWVRVFTQK